MFSDFHSHLDDYSPDQLKSVLDKARDERVEIILGNGTNLDASLETVNIAQHHQGVFAAVGIHPWQAIPPTKEVLKKLGEMAKQKGVAAIGEVGLDYARSPDTKETQKDLFRQQVDLAGKLNLPMNVHCKEAHQDMMAILKQMGGSRLKGAAHGFSGDMATLTDWLNLGFYVSIGPRAFTRTYTPAFGEAVKRIPLDHLLIETDSSGKSLASGEMEGPASVIIVAEKLAEILGKTPEEIGDTATANIKRLLAINWPGK